MITSPASSTVSRGRLDLDGHAPESTDTSRWLADTTVLREAADPSPPLAPAGMPTRGRRRGDNETPAVADQRRQAQKMVALGELTGSIVHDYNNLLLVIGGSLEVLSRHMVCDARTRRLIDAALQGVAHGARLNQQLLAFSRRHDLHTDIVSLDDLVESFGQLLERVANHSITVKVEHSSHLWFCRTDTHQLESAVLNLAINARDAMPNGGTITLSTANRVVSAEEASHVDARAGEYVVISVGDTGVGMSPEVAARAFETFFTTKVPGQGTGFGLNQVQRLARQSGGFVTLVSEPGRGTLVGIHLPRSEQRERTMQAPRQVTSVEQGRGTVLVVEDDPGVRETVSAMLRDLGYSAREVQTARAALVLIECGEAIDLVLCDAAMPGVLNGPELATLLRTTRPDLPVILTTGYSGVPPAPGTEDDGIFHLSKPYSLFELAQFIKEARGFARVPYAEGPVTA